MVFSSVTFLFYFFPCVLLLYCLLPCKNVFLLLVSLFFYAWGEVSFVLLLLVSIGANYAFGLLINRQTSVPLSRIYLIFGLAVNLLLLGFFKYGNFLVDNVNWLFVRFDIQPMVLDSVHLPLGISFFTFQAMSYLVDVYRGTSAVEKNPMNLGLYISMFPQLVAGPIVRFNEIVDQIHERSITSGMFANGVRRFVVGLGQKMLIANPLAIPADAIFSIPAENLTPGLAWLGVAAYTLQIYFDFAGYSSMAIGLGMMFGFRLPENFNYPYISQSITEFWRRWHMSLSAWFRDYLYIPLGGNRISPIRTYINLVVVFFLCGLWHGASWTFVVWGLFHGAFLVLERIGMGKKIANLWHPLRHLYVVIIVAVGWVFFRSETFGFALDFLSAMAGFAYGDGLVYNVWQYLSAEVILVLVIGIIGAAPVISAIRRRWLEILQPPVAGPEAGLSGVVIHCVETLAVFGILALVAMSLAAKTHNPFIYFRF